MDEIPNNNGSNPLAGLLPSGGGATSAIPGAGFTGTGAKVQGAVLTFTQADGKSASYKVIRPKGMTNTNQTAAAAASSDNTGTWLSIEDGGKAIMFNVQSDNSVTGKEMPAALVQMLMGGVQR